MDPNRTLFVFSGELDALERSCSAEFVALQTEASKAHPSAHTLHLSARRILDDAHLASLFFFPSKSSKPPAVQRADLLKSHFEISKSSQLASRLVRNHLANIDDRLDTWAEISANNTFGRNMIGTLQDAERLGINSEDILGLICTNTLDYYFLGDRINLEEIIQEMRILGFAARRTRLDMLWPRDKMR